MPSLTETLRGAGHRPRAPEGRAPGRRGAAAEVAAGVLRGHRDPGRSHARHQPARRPGRLRRALPRGRPHGALRARRRLAAVRGARPRRQLRHRRPTPSSSSTSCTTPPGWSSASAGATRTSSSRSSASTSCTSSDATRQAAVRAGAAPERQRAGKAKRYADLLTTALGVRYNPADYLFDLDDGFYSARYLRAWAFEAQLRRRLEADFGREWFLSAEAGARLKRLWSHGAAPSGRGAGARNWLFRPRFRAALRRAEYVKRRTIC